MTNLFYKLLPACLLLLWSFTTKAQQPLYEEERIPLPSEEIRHVNGIAGDGNNCIWFTTQTGIYRYDGSHFRHYSVANTPVLKFERMASISTIQGEYGLRWIMKDSKGGLYEVDDKSRIRQFKKRENEEYIHNLLGKPLLDQNTSFLNQSPNDDIVETFTIRSIKKAFFFTTDSKVVRCDISSMRNGKRDSVYQFPIKNYPGNLNRLFYSLNAMYVVTNTKILSWRDQDNAVEIKLTGDILLTNNNRIIYDSLWAFPTTDPRNLIFLYKNSYYAVSETGPNHLDTRLLVNFTGIERPVSFYYSSTQQLLITYFLSKGLVFYRPKQFSLLTFSTEENKQDYYYSVVATNDGFFTINNDGLVELPLAGSPSLLYPGKHHKFFIYTDKNNNLWFKNGLYLLSYNKTSKKVTRLLETDGENLSGVIEKGNDTYYILGGYNFIKCRMNDGILIKKEDIFASEQNTQLNFLFEPRNNIFWIGTDRGLIEYDCLKKSFRDIPELKNTYLRSACKLGDNNFLIGCYDKGIFQYFNGKWYHLYSSPKQLPPSAHAFIIDRSTSSLWVSSNTGIYRIPLTELLNRNTENSEISFRHFTQFGAKIPAEFNGSSNASAATLSGKYMAFTNARGIVVFNPRQLLLSPLPVNVLIESTNENDSLSSEVGYSRHIEFNPIVPYHGNLEELDIKYQLTNTDKNWHSLTPNAVITYNDVKPGQHDLKFRIRHQHSADEKELALIATSFYIPYKWYQTNWFKALALMLIAAIIIATHNFRIWYLRKRKKELEKMVLDKTSELKETNNTLVDVIDELSKSEYSLRQSNFLKDEYYAVLTHDLRSPLKFLAFHLRHMLERYPDINQLELKQGLAVANQTSYDIHKLIDEFAYWIQENEQQLVAQPAPTLINAIVADAKKIYQYSMEENKNQFIAEVDPELSFITDPKLLFIIIRNAVDNANKYCRNGGITVSAKRKNDQLEISVTDTGRGISDEMALHLSSLQYENFQLSYKQRKSLGFYIMAILTKKLGGSYSLISEKDVGTRLKFIFPELNLHHEDPHR